MEDVYDKNRGALELITKEVSLILKNPISYEDFIKIQKSGIKHFFKFL